VVYVGRSNGLVHNTARLTLVETLHVTSLQGFQALRFSRTEQYWVGLVLKPLERRDISRLYIISFKTV
jgi:hypothetical protein